MMTKRSIESESIKYFLKFLGAILILSIPLRDTAYAENLTTLNTVKSTSSNTSTTTKSSSEKVIEKTNPIVEFNDESLFSEIKGIKDRGEIVVAMYYKDRPPFYFVNKEGKLVGNDPELAEEIAKAIDPSIKVRYIRTARTFDEIIQQVHQGQADIGISKLSYTVQRSKRVLYAKSPYIQLYTAFLVNRSAPNSLSLAELFNKKSPYSLCAIKGSSQVKIAQGLFPEMKLLELPTAEDTLIDLNTGKCIAIIHDTNELRKTLFENPKLNLHYKSVILNSDPDSIYIVTDPAKPNLAGFIDELIANNPKNIRRLDDIFSKYEDQLR
jgi:polar amino acid transport system substrate-binding protein